MWRCLVFVVAVSIWTLEVETVPQGDNTCQGVVKHPVKVKVNVTEPVTFRTYTWCLRVPPRCSKYVVQMRERVKEQIELHNRTITVCCRGYVEMESKCVPACPPMTECPFMHCNRTNHCYCSPGYSGVFCNDPCPKGSWGKDCKKPCDCPDGFTCHHLTGDCMLDDKPSIKTTVRRAFTHISSESVPVTLKTVISTTERNIKTTTSTPTTKLKTTSLNAKATSQVTTDKPYIPTIQKSFVSTEKPLTKNRITLPGSKTSSSVISSTAPNIVSTSSVISLSTPSSTTLKPTVLTIIEPATTKVSSTRNNNIDLATPTSSLFVPTPQHSTFLPPLDPYLISTEHLSTTETISTQRTSHLPDIAWIPVSKTKQERNQELPLEKYHQFDENQSTTEYKDFVTSENIEKSSMGPATIHDLSDVTSELNNVNDVFTTDILTPTPHKTEINMEPQLNFRTKPVLQASEPSNDFQPLTEFTLSPTFTSVPPTSPHLVISSTLKTSPEFYEIHSEGLPDETNKPIIIPTSTPSAFFDRLPITNTVDGPLAPMQTPNRNWNPFIPSPVSTKSDIGLTIPFSVNNSTNFKTDATLDFTAKTLENDFWNVKSAEKSPGKSGKQLESTTAKSTSNTFIANTFLHSFLEPTDSSNEFPEKSLSSLVQGNFLTSDKPYIATNSVMDGNNNFENKRYESSTSMAAAAESLPDILHSKDDLLGLSKNIEDKEYITHSSIKNFVTEPIPVWRTLLPESNLLNNPLRGSTIATPTSTIQTSQTAQDIAISAIEDFNVYHQSTTKKPENSYTDAVGGNSIWQTSQGVLNTLATKSVDSKDESLKPIMFYTDKLNPKIITAERENATDLGNIESVNILAKNAFISLVKSKQAVKSFSDIGTTEKEKEKPHIKEIVTETNFIPSTYSIYDKTAIVSRIPKQMLDNVPSDRKDLGTTHHSKPFDKVPDSTPMITNEINSIVNGKLLEEPSNYLPTLNEKPTPPSGYLGYVSQGELMKSTKENSVTRPPPLGYLPTNKDFLNLTYILNSINDFTSKSRRGMKQSISSMYGHSSRVKFTDPPPLNELVTNAVNDRKPSTEVFKTPFVQPTRKPERNSGTHPHREKNTVSDSKIIHLNISRHVPYLNPTSKFVPKFSSDGFKNLVSTYFNDPSVMTTPIDGRITTVSIISTVPDTKYLSKRSTKDYYDKTVNTFTTKVPPEELEGSFSFGITNHGIQDIIYNAAVTPASVSVTPIPMQPVPVIEEVSKKPFRRKDDFSTYDELEDVGSNMTAALAAHSSEKGTHISLMTGILATITCILLLGSFASAIVFFIYCKKEKPVPMESCIMAYEQNDSDPSSIYSVPRPSISPEIFFCPTFSHHYAAQINKELRELSYGSTKDEKSEPFYTEISIETTSA